MAFKWGKKRKPNVTNLNNFIHDTELPEDVRTKIKDRATTATTSDIAAYKMLQNVTPEMLQDPEFVKQLNRFIGGNMASMVSEKMSHNGTIDQKKTAFRGNEMAITNATTLQNMYLPQEVLEKMDSDLGDDFKDNNVMKAGLQNIKEFMNTDMGGNMADLFGQISQGMNDQGFTDTERSQMMMNHMMLRSVSPYFAKKALPLPLESQERKRNLATAVQVQNVINRPEEFNDKEFINSFIGQLDTAKGVTRQQAGYQMPARGMSTRVEAEKPQEKKKKWWKFWKK